MSPFSLRSLLLAAIVLSNCISWTASRHHYTHNVSGHRSRHRRQGAGLFLSASYVLPGGEGAGWGEWGEVSPCSRTCGGGVASQKRICVHLGPDGSPQCTGGDTKYFSCETQDCPAGSRDFREQQCSEFDDQVFRDVKYRWVPYKQAPNPCELNCMPQGERFYYRHRSKVVDGTRCNDESFDVCVNGTCQPVGCDMMLGSNAREDKCRECRGKGVNCQTTSGLLDQENTKGYSDLLLIPEGATNIFISERGPSRNYLALRAQNNTFYLNGNYQIDFPRSLTIAGALWYYERSQQGFAAPDKLRCLGPTNEPLYLAILLQDENVGIEYEYSVPNDRAPPKNKEYNWAHEEFSNCSAPCGGGYQTRNVSCRSREELELVDEALCDKELMPVTNQSCNTDACAAKWTPGSWGECSKRCGPGGSRSREVHCTQIISNGYESIVGDKSCFDIHGPKPPLHETCNDNATCPIWFAGPWKPCDRLCDEGKQTRKVVCYHKDGSRKEILSDDECVDEKPATEQACLLQPCDGVDWVLSEWTGCDSCLSTIRTRTAVCSTKDSKVVNDSFCSYHAKPVLQEPCDKTKLPACDVQWYATQWSNCSVECGKGIQSRKVFCGLFDGASVMKVEDGRCLELKLAKYNDTKECEVPEDKCPAQWFAGPWTSCSKTCGGGEQYRRVMCLRGGSLSVDCNEDVVVFSHQACNNHSCEDAAKTPAPLDDDYDDDCEDEEDEEEEEVGLDSESSLTTLDDLMFSDSSTTVLGGSDVWTSTTAEHESTLEDLDELLPTGTGSTGNTSSDLTEESGSGDYTTDISTTDEGYSTTTKLDDTGSTSNETDSTITELSGSTESAETETVNTGSTVPNTVNLKKLQQVIVEEKDDSVESYFDSSEDDDEDAGGDDEGDGDDIDDIDDDLYPEYEDTSESKESSETYSTTASGETSDTKPTESKGSTLNSESGPTDTSDSTTVSNLTSSTDTEVTTESGATSETTETSESQSTLTTESGATDETTVGSSSKTGETSESEATVTEETTTTGTDETVTTESTETPDTSETSSTETSSTESTVTAESDTTITTESESTGSTESTDISTTKATETGSTSSAETSESSSSGSTETTEISTTVAVETSESDSTDISKTTVSGSTVSDDTAVSGSIESTSESESTVASVTIESGITGSSDTTETETTAASDITENVTTEVTGSIETGTIGTTEATDTAETGNAYTSETTEASKTTETGSTSETESGTTESIESTTSGSTESTESAGTESSASFETSTDTTESTTAAVSGSTEEVTTEESELSTTEASSGVTHWDLSSTVEVFTTTKKSRGVCKRRSCAKSEFGCCSDKKTPALGPFDEGCPKPQTCKEAAYGCCPDGVSPSQGHLFEGCPVEPCAETLFGCCNSDNKTAAEGNDQEGCPPPPPACLASRYGCCKDETEAKGPRKEGCPETSTTTVSLSTTEETDETVETTTSSSTETIENCGDTLYGCCFDNQTAASGPELQGCPCDTSAFGCCPDDVSTAQGENMEGCVKSCNTSAYGCCADGKSPAHGPDNEGCCLIYPYGCCPDNYKPADGPHLEGCACQDARFGCCPDNVTVATGPNNKGCGCQYSEHGCCPDRHTEASGPEFEGCLCHTYQFGCCPDGVIAAEGPNGQGCYCQQSKYGCCGDEQTHATGPKGQGCNCGNSKHGCCLDGTTEAKGPKFEGCKDKPLDRQAACSLKFERGPCRNYSVGWFYDTEYGGCSRFWYGGCEGNGNRFSSKEECEDVCVSPPPKDACKLPKIKGACLAYNQRWYYDTEHEMCSNFIYGGCLGNANNFESRELCQAQCEPERAIDQCSLAIETGSCTGEYSRWGYNKETRRCTQFVWGGCEGNSNRFSSEAACMLRCNPPGKPRTECSETQNVGNGTDIEARWSFSQTENRCVPFYYTGSGGNDNKYTTREQCEEACPSAFVPELCTLAASTGDCYDYREKWYYDTKNQRCGMFYYGGCGGNENRFDTEQECVNRCIPPATTAAPRVTAAPETNSGSEFCVMEIDAGPCNQMETRWGYDDTRGKCVSFQYGGCGGNRNNFPTEDHCAYYCKPSQDICQLPMLSGPCDESVMRWFYDATSDSCSQFTYGGCDGNDNRFETREECENRCKSGAAPTPSITTTTAKAEERVPSECATSPELEQCSRETIGEVWFYDQVSAACKAHENLESGTECRTTGVFYSQEACERSCGNFRNIDVCQYEMEPGPCRDFRSKYFYNKNTSRCEEFAYGGCFGGANRFSTEQECEQICMSTVDPCTLPAEPGNCLGHMEMWYYHPDRDQCYQFVYGGCGGNDNKFESREACEGRCRNPPAVTTTTLAPPPPTRQPEPAEECRTPASLAPCGSNETVYYFDEATRSCRAADIGGCGSSLNLYRSEEECERRCGAFRGIDVCRAQLDPGPCRGFFPKFYFDAASGSCKGFTYGGCRGGANRFSTVDECEDICAAAGPAPACLLPVETGDQCSEVPERRWHYDVTRANCLVFSYQGCGGNANNFYSYEECAYHCRVTSEPNVCDSYTEECRALETTCLEGLKMSTSPEGCHRCECEAPVNCDEPQRQCEALRCRYGVEHTATLDGCVKCACVEDPCVRANCTAAERCVVEATRDPMTQEPIYFAHCESNEVDCGEYALECSRLECPYGLQRTRVGNCERCSCVQEETNCTLLRRDCDVLKCNYGVNRTLGADGCERCVCLPPPCQALRCSSGERCVSAPFRDPVSGETRYTATCQSVSKAGSCPSAGAALDRSTEGACHSECRDDADCRGVLKCCARGCSQLCLEPAPPATPPPSTTHTPDVPRAPEANTESRESRPQVDAAEGGLATLRCYFHGNPPPKITWRFGEVTIDGDAGRYRLLSDGALEIISLFRNDSGVYICVAQNEYGSAQQQVTLTVADPEQTAAAIAGTDDPVTGVLGLPLVVRCQAYGYPPPTIYWYRNEGNEMVAFSNALFEARGQDLTIRRLAFDTLGVYECQAYNGVGAAATWRVTVQADRPPGETRRSPYLVDREVFVTPRTPVPIWPAPLTTTEKPIFVFPSYVPVHTSLPSSLSVSVGAQLSLPCDVDGYPVPEVRWTKDDVPLATNDLLTISASRLSIQRAEPADAGVYACHASNAYSSHSSAVRVTVQELAIPPTCIDNPTFANCALIVQSRFCVHKYYSKFCCKSCVEAGQLDPRDALMQADQSVYRK